MKWLCFSLDIGVFWFRIFGYGARIINRKIHPPLFSSRGKERVIFGYGVKILKGENNG